MPYSHFHFWHLLFGSVIADVARHFNPFLIG